jgi:hypothetical protein
MKRTLSNWIEAYLEFTENTESAKQFHLWCAISTIASVLRRKTWLSLGRLTYFPNIYIVLVAQPGIARKTQAIKFALEILKQVPGITISADSITKEALIDDLEISRNESVIPGTDGPFFHCSLSVISKEFESFLGQKKENTKMLVLLTDLYDCPDSFEKKTKHSGVNILENVFFNLQAATTPDSLASSLPSTAIGGGLTSRILFIWADAPYKKEAIPELTERERSIRKQLISDLFEISQISGEYKLPLKVRSNWIEWYNQYEMLSPKRICQEPIFNSWYSRKPDTILKTSINIAAAKRQDLIIEWEDITTAIKYIEVAEKGMSNSFRAVGKSLIASEVDTVLSLIQVRGAIEEKQIMALTWKDMDSDKFDNVIETAIRTGKVKRDYRNPDGRIGGIWYYWATGMKPRNVNN